MLSLDNGEQAHGIDDVGELTLSITHPGTESTKVLLGFEVFEDNAAFGMPTEAKKVIMTIRKSVWAIQRYVRGLVVTSW